MNTNNTSNIIFVYNNQDGCVSIVDGYGECGKICVRNYIVECATLFYFTIDLWEIVFKKMQELQQVKKYKNKFNKKYLTNIVQL